MDTIEVCKKVAHDLVEDGLALHDIVDRIVTEGVEDNETVLMDINEHAMKVLDDEEYDLFQLWECEKYVKDWIMHEIGVALGSHPFTPQDYNWEDNTGGGDL